MNQQSGMIELEKGRYFVGIWYFARSRNPELKNQDWLGVVFRDEGDPRWHLRYRHKYYNSPDPWDPKDRRSSFAGSMKGIPEPELLLKMQQVVALAASAGDFEQPEFVYLGTDDPEAILERIKDKPWAHLKIQEQAKAEGPPPPTPERDL